MSGIICSEKISIIFSVASLIISFLSLYFTHIKSANIMLLKTKFKKSADVKMDGGWSGVWPSSLSLNYKLYIENTGSNPGSFEGIEVELRPNNFENFYLIPSNKLFLESLNSGSSGWLERTVINEKTIIPVKLEIRFEPKFKSGERTGENFKLLWHELCELRRKGNPQIIIKYCTLEHKDCVSKTIEKFKLLLNKSKKEVVIDKIADDIINNIFLVRFEELKDNPQCKNLIEECLSNLKI